MSKEGIKREVLISIYFHVVHPRLIEEHEISIVSFIYTIPENAPCSTWIATGGQEPETSLLHMLCLIAPQNGVGDSKHRFS